MAPRRTPVTETEKKTKTGKKKATSKKKVTKKKVIKAASEESAPKKTRKSKSKPKKPSDTVRLTLEADATVVDRFKTLYEWFKAERDEAEAETVALLIFQAGLDHFEKSLEDTEEPASGDLVELSDEDEDENPDYDDAFVSFARGA